MESYFKSQFPIKPSKQLKACCEFYEVINKAFPKRENLVGVHMSVALALLEEITELERKLENANAT